MEGDLLNCCCCRLLIKSPYAQHLLSCYLAFLYLLVFALIFCTVCGFDILVSSCNSAGLVNMLYQILLLWYNNGSRCVTWVIDDLPVYDIATGNCLTVLYILSWPKF